MALTITQPTAGYIGQGIQVFGTAPTFTAGDYVDVTVSDFALGLQGSTGRNPMTSTSWQVTLGFDGQSGQYENVQNGLDIGHALGLSAAQFNSGGGFVDSVFQSGYFHDPVTGMSGLLALSGGATLVGLDPSDPTVAELVGNTQGGEFHFPLIGVL